MTDVKKNIGQTRGQLKDRLHIHRKHIQQPEQQQSKTEEHLRPCGKRIFVIFTFLKMKENSKSLKES